MTLQPLPSEFPNIEGNFIFFFISVVVDDQNSSDQNRVTQKSDAQISAIIRTETKK